MAAYDWRSPLLCDTLREDDVVKERKMKSLLVEGAAQLSLFDIS